MVELIVMGVVLVVVYAVRAAISDSSKAQQAPARRGSGWTPPQPGAAPPPPAKPWAGGEMPATAPDPSPLPAPPRPSPRRPAPRPVGSLSATERRQRLQELRARHTNVQQTPTSGQVGSVEVTSAEPETSAAGATPPVAPPMPPSASAADPGLHLVPEPRRVPAPSRPRDESMIGSSALESSLDSWIDSTATGSLFDDDPTLSR